MHAVHISRYSPTEKIATNRTMQKPGKTANRTLILLTVTCKKLNNFHGNSTEYSCGFAYVKQLDFFNLYE